ncbi:polysaccharide export protein [Sphingomonas populi]|uniref:Polysaccharide export protein n=1 Tax=Sphingomonas populi TaxID=2484750 RepID=A0A4Q6XLY7_9SPHN|nr:polysaccharide biosynthesis/export family protein [Sphingomonas populi]RZF60901.1 polysaccharide export protein [Sphingomonas populi]
MHRKILFTLVASSLLGACASLPSSGPTGKHVRDSAALVQPDGVGIQLVEVSDASAMPAGTSTTKSVFPEFTPPPTDMIGPGDVLSITIYEAGVTLFGGGAVVTGGKSGAFDPSVKAQALPPARVDDSGDIVVPYAGKLRVMGKTASEVQDQIRRALRGVSADPQILVSLAQVITNSVIVGGEVARPGRLVLQTNREKVSDVIALAGGQRGNTKDIALRISRGSNTIDMRLSELFDNPSADITAYPGDRLTLLQSPLTFSVLGAPGRVDQLPFTRSSMSLAEAVASAGGSNPNLGDPAAIFVFRYVADENGNPKPVVYHLNMMETRSYFLAQKFAMHDKDILYFGNARANQPSKMVQLISQLFSPILTVTSAVQTVQNSRN